MCPSWPRSTPSNTGANGRDGLNRVLDSVARTANAMWQGNFQNSIQCFLLLPCSFPFGAPGWCKSSVFESRGNAREATEDEALPGYQICSDSGFCRRWMKLKRAIRIQIIIIRNIESYPVQIRSTRTEGHQMTTSHTSWLRATASLYLWLVSRSLAQRMARAGTGWYSKGEAFQMAARWHRSLPRHCWEAGSLNPLLAAAESPEPGQNSG